MNDVIDTTADTTHSVRRNFFDEAVAIASGNRQFITEPAHCEALQQQMGRLNEVIIALLLMQGGDPRDVPDQLVAECRKRNLGVSITPLPGGRVVALEFPTPKANVN